MSKLKPYDPEKATTASGKPLERLPAKPYDEFPKLVKAGFASMAIRYADASRMESQAKAVKASLKDPLKDALATLPKGQDSVLVPSKVGDIRATYCRGETNKTINRDTVVKNCLRLGVDPDEVLRDAEEGGEEYFYALITAPKEKKEGKS